MRTHLYRKPPRTGNYYISYFMEGQRYRKSLKTANYAVARAMQKTIEQELVQDKLPAPKKKVPVVTFEQRYFAFARDHKRPKTVLSDRRAWNSLLEKTGIRFLAEVNRSVVEEYIGKLLSEGLKKSSVNVYLRHLSSMFSQAVKWRLIAHNPLRGIAKFKTSEKKIAFLTPDEITRVLECAERYGRDMHLVFALGIYAGLRRNEIANAKWSWFDFESNVIHVVNEDGFETKSGRTRAIPLNEKLKQILLKYQQGESGFMFSPEHLEWKNLVRYDFRKAFATVCEEAELPWVTPHVLRHTFASRLAIAGVSLYKISQWLGHADFRTTQIYAHLQASDSDINQI